MRVKAAPGIRFPREDKPRNYIEQDETEVPATAYYLKAIVDGDLVDLDAAKPAASKAAASTNTTA
ncbi:hypothetical protein OR16_31739 [Cupriavidus basilensis OR16]|uniref:DUF2635 domain-containing protein n=1 Tax=Cupriavidus basilensis OR16 TaxID=1127483 RepID=H1SDH1_9BURK|nr:hypothetical protein [Cupriavidus basilensis]EHP39425.1 hypothetical protein OR16_31739 [Cupriavidus basilensis OR16]